jgi:sigma-B regulation protein RsbU (phosphoserine phosphatase)
MVVGTRPSAVHELGDALRRGGFDVRQAIASGTDPLAEPGVRPDIVVVSADLGLRRVALLSEGLAVRGRLPTTLVYPESDLAALETCVRGGFDYVTPPFRPALLRMRLTSCWERGELTMAVEEMANAASLLAYERDLSIARTIQQDFLPDRIPVPDGWQLAVKFRPANQVAGDFYDVFPVAGGRLLATVVADVCDKGLGAAMFVALIRTMLRHSAEQASEPGTAALLHAVAGTNSYLARHHHRQGYFCTVLFAMVEPTSGALRYVNGGHNPAILVRADGRHALLPPTGPALGVFRDSRYRVAHDRMEPGDRLLMYTDGVPEARSAAGEFFGMDRVLDLATRHWDSTTGLLDAVDTAVRRHAGDGSQHDDITMLALRRLPVTPVRGTR